MPLTTCAPTLSGDPGSQSLRKIQLGHLIYDFDFGGSAVGLRDEYNIGRCWPRTVNTTTTPTQGNVYRVDSGRWYPPYSGGLLYAECGFDR